MEAVIAQAFPLLTAAKEPLKRLYPPYTIIGLASFVLSLVGYALGHRFGKVITRRLKPELFGGIILILIGLKILLTS